MRKNLLVLCLFLLVLSLGVSAQEGEVVKLTSLPPIFETTVEITRREEGKKERFIQLEHLITTNQQVNQALADTVARMDEELNPFIVPDPNGKAISYSRLDVEINRQITGQSWLSTLTIGRVTHRRQQTHLDFEAAVFDLRDGRRLSLTDIFPEDSPAWDLLSKRVTEHLHSIYPDLDRDRDQAAIQGVATREALEQASFTLGGMELTLHYHTRNFGFDLPGMIHVRFFYPEFQGMFTPEAALQTDNRHFNMVAITCDDGPRWPATGKSLDAFRRGGARVTYFVCGNMIEENNFLLRRQFDANHIIANHSFSHKSGYSLQPDALIRQITNTDKEILKITGEETALFRAPMGLYPGWQKAEISLPLIQWSLDTFDFRSHATERSVLNAIKKYVQNGDIILMHDSRPLIEKSVPVVAEYLSQHGYLMVTVDELAWAEGVQMEANILYSRLVDGDYSPRFDSNTHK